MDNTNSAIDIEKYYSEQSVRHLISSVFGGVYLDEDRVSLINAWSKARNAEYLEVQLRSIMSDIIDGNTSSIMVTMEENRKIFMKSTVEYNSLISKVRNRNV